VKSCSHADTKTMIEKLSILKEQTHTIEIETEAARILGKIRDRSSPLEPCHCCSMSFLCSREH
jgi:hypothetical protein